MKGRLNLGQKKQFSQFRFTKTIKGQIQLLVISLITIVLLSISIISYYLNYYSIVETLKVSMQKIAELSAIEIQYRITSLMNVVEVLGTIKEFSDDNVLLEEKRLILDEHMNAYSLRSSRIMDTHGISIFDPEKDLSERDYFKEAMKGKVAISDPIYSSTNGELIISIAAPVWKNGIRNSEISGVVMVTQDARELSQIAAQIQVSEHAGAFMLNSEGTTIAHSDYTNVEEQVNNIIKAATDKNFEDAARIDTIMIQGKKGTEFQSFGGRRTDRCLCSGSGLK